MGNLIIELSHEEVEIFKGYGNTCEEVYSQDLDGQSLVNIIVTIASLPISKLIIDALLTISKKRQTSSIKINGIEIQNVSQELVEKLLKDVETK